MTLAKRLAQQLARPHGIAGKLLGAAMDVVNRRPLELAVNLLDPQDGECVLDAGCGTGAAMAAMLRRAACSMTGADASATMLGAARHRLGDRADYALSRLEDLPFAPGTFHAVLALNVLYFDGAGQPMLRELHRLLRPGGRLVAYVTDKASMAGWAFARQGLHRLYDADELTEAFAVAGFAQDAIEVQDVPISRGVTGLLAKATRTADRV